MGHEIGKKMITQMLVLRIDIVESVAVGAVAKIDLKADCC